MTRGSFIERLLRGLARLLPAAFRDEFGDAVDADLAERRLAGDRTGLLRYELPSLVRAIGREHHLEIRQDVKYAFRMMRRAPGFTAAAVLMFALGTGANVAMFSVIDAVMLRSPFLDPDRLFELQVADRPGHFTLGVPPAQYAALAENRAPFVGVAAGWAGPHVLTGTGDPFTPSVECQSASMFDVLGTRPLIGRTFTNDEDRPGAPATAVLSYGLWQRLGGSPSLVGSTITLNQTPVSVLGVMPANFAGPRSRADVGAWVPLNRPIAGGGFAGCSNLKIVNVIARLPPGTTRDAAQARRPDFRLLSHQEQTYGELRTPLVVLSGAVLCVLLIACFNVAGLQIERTLARQREMSIRAALGASRGRLARQTLTENLILALLGSAAGLVAGAFLLRTVVVLLPGNVPHVNEIALNGRALAMALVIAALAGVASGWLPNVLTRATGGVVSAAASTRATGRHGSAGRRTLVLAEVALSTTVLIGAGLMLQTFLTLRPSRPGFEADNKVMLSVRLPSGSPDAAVSFFNGLLDRLHATLGPRVAGVQVLPRIFGSTAIAPVKFAETTRMVGTSVMTPRYLELMGIPVVAGRTFAETDTSASTPVAIINEQFAKRVAPKGSAVGIVVLVGDSFRSEAPPVEPRVIIGVVGNTRASGNNTLPTDELYLPYAQRPTGNLIIVAAAGRSAATELRAAVRALGPDLVVGDVQSMPAQLDRSVQFWRFGAWLLSMFGGLAVALAAIGLMTTASWSVRERTREIGVRVALGASRQSIGTLILKQGLLTAAAGIAVGCVIAAGATKYLASWLYGVAPLDRPTFVLGSGAMLAVAAIAMVVPVKRATSVDPVVTLRAD